MFLCARPKRNCHTRSQLNLSQCFHLVSCCIIWRKLRRTPRRTHTVSIIKTVSKTLRITHTVHCPSQLLTPGVTHSHQGFSSHTVLHVKRYKNFCTFSHARYYTIQGCWYVLSPTRLKKQLKGRHYSSDAEVTAAAETWLDGQPSDYFFFLSGLQKLEFGRCSLFPS